jgi:hypothetical protein
VAAVPACIVVALSVMALSYLFARAYPNAWQLGFELRYMLIALGAYAVAVALWKRLTPDSGSGRTPP